VGSSTGQKEFVGADGSDALNHFGSGDIPMTDSRYAEVTATGRKMLHVPFGMGAIGVFHSVPTAELGGEPLDLTGCLLAKIFSRQITTWDDPEIKAVNPKMTYTGAIKVVHRVKGSSSTAGFTSYLQGKCPASWSLGSGSTIVWPEGTFEAQGSGGMSDFIADPANSGAIGYIDAGHGHGAGLGEVKLMNRAGLYLSTKEADIGAAGSIALAATPSVIPGDATADFSAVNLYDLEGATTWPITMISYFYLDQDMRSYDPMSAALVMYFVKFILSEEGQQLAADNLFEKLPRTLLDFNAVALASITLPSNAPMFSTETKSTTLPRTGAGEFYISGKRSSFADVERESNKKAIDANTASIDALQAGRRALARCGVRGGLPTPAWQVDSGADKETRNMAIAGLALGSVGFLMGLVAFINVMIKSRGSMPRSVEIPARDLSVPAAVSQTSATPTKDAV